MVVLYTPMPLEAIFPPNSESTTRYVQRGRQLLEVEPIDFNRARIVRLISTDPQDYLNTECQPGNIL